MGYSLAGFDVVGVDQVIQNRYPFEMIQGDAMQIVKNKFITNTFDLIHASPPCQEYSSMKGLSTQNHPKLIVPLRESLKQTGKPYVIENVMGAPLRAPLFLCGAMFPGVMTYRHRLFECSFKTIQPFHQPHVHPVAKMGRAPKEGEFIQLTGNFTGVDYARAVTGLTWMSTREISQAIPPAFTEYVGKELINHINNK